MGTKTIRLDEDVYERVKAKKRADETFSEAIDRLVGGGNILDLYGLRSEKGTGEMREAIEDAKGHNRERVEELRDRAHSRR
jgi:predicted CopG family antitoxin